ncbi:MAG TPA: ankyrin repeat domain-containing protein [Gemmatales bacterium]|nr:ankyrin repeat domain-containing protein [Gemmatales bacterium]
MSLLLLSLLLLAPIADEPLTIKFEPNQPPDIIEYDKTFKVVITNTSNQAIRLWKNDARQGYYQLTFQFTNARTGEKQVVSRKEIDEGYLSKSGRRGDAADRDSDFVTLEPMSDHEISILFSSYLMWKGLPSPNIADSYRLTAKFKSKPGPEAVKQSVWTGVVASKELTISFIAAKLKTPHQYLWDGFPDRAVDMMNADPTWINKQDKDQCTPLHHAARFGHHKAVLWLLNNGANVNAKAYNNFTPLDLSDDPEVVELILQKKPDLSPEGNGSAFHKALSELTSARNEIEKKKWQKIVELYLKAGTEYDLATAIHLNDLSQVEKILAKSSRLADNFQGRSPLRLAASLGRLEICQYLIEKYNVDVNDFEGGNGYPILKEALKFPKVVKLLIDHKVDLKTRITWQRGRSGVWIIGDDATALHHAAADGVPETVKILLNAGVDLFATAAKLGQRNNQPEQTALDVAAFFGKSGNMEVMLNHPRFKAARPDVRQAVLDRCLVAGSYPSWLAREPDRFKMLQLLVAQGANPLTAINGRSGIQVAVESLHPPSDREENGEIKKIIAFYRSKGAGLSLFGAVAIEDEAEVNRLLKLDPKCASDRRSDGYPALHFAVSLNNKNIATSLLKAGCDVDIRNHSENMGGYDSTPLHAAAFWGQYDIARMLIDAGADINAVSTNKHDPKFKSTPLSEARRLSNNRIAQLLIEKGAKE